MSKSPQVDTRIIPRHPGRRTIAEQLTRRKAVLSMVAKSMTIEMISSQLNVDTRTVRDDIKWVRETYAIELAEEYQTKVADQLARIAHLEQVTWQTFETSEDKNHQYLNTVLRCIQERSKLLGLNAKQDEGGATDDIPIITVQVETREDITDVMTVQEILKTNTINGKVLGKEEKNDD